MDCFLKNVIVITNRVIIRAEVFNMSTLRFYIRHQKNFLQDKMILVFKSDEAKQYFQHALKGSTFEQVTSEEAENAARIGIHGNTIPYGYTIKLTKEEMNQRSEERRVGIERG